MIVTEVKMNKNDISKMPGLTISSPLFFNEDESIDYDTLGRYLDDVCQNKQISAVYSMAYNTRYRMLDDDEVFEVNKFIAERVDGHEKNVYVGHPYIFTRSSLEKYLKRMSSLPVSGVSMLYPERYYGVDEPIIEFLQLPAKFGLSVVLHEMKLVSGFNGELINWPAGLLNRVFSEVELVAVKEDSKDDEITEQVLGLCNQKSIHCVLAGGGKVRAKNFFDLGLTTWLNGSTMFAPQLIDQVYEAFTSGDEEFMAWYLEHVEAPFFNRVVSKVGWHLAHKAALEYFGYGKRYERFPHAVLGDQEAINANKVFRMIENSISSLDE